MRGVHHVTEPDFSDYIGTPGIDFVRFFSTKRLKISLPKERYFIRALHAAGRDGMLLTIHDPKVKDLEVVANELPEAIFESLEVYYNFTPKGFLSPVERHELIEIVRQWVLTHLHPWGAPGLQIATRTSYRKGRVEPVYNDDVERRAERHETMYIGHSDPRYADPSKPNFAFMRLYRKITDSGPLPPRRHCCHLEVNLNQTGCLYFGLRNPSDLFGFKFRKLSHYFRFALPAIRPYVMPKLRATNSRMARLLEQKRMQMATETLRNVGSHAASGEKLIIVDGRHRHKDANKMIQKRLDDLSKKYSKGKKPSIYGSEWGSW